ncbi:Ubiquitin-like-specific protease 1A, partial [Tetrabaena socialis]
RPSVPQWTNDLVDSDDDAPTHQGSDERTYDLHVRDAVAAAQSHSVLRKVGSAERQSWASSLNLLKPGNEIIVTFYPHPGAQYQLLRMKLLCLAHGLELIDEVVNLYMLLLTEHDCRLRNEGGAPRCHFFSSFFWNKLWQDGLEYNFQNVARWTSDVRLMNACQATTEKTVLHLDRVYAPIFIPSPVKGGIGHWILVEIDLKSQKLRLGEHEEKAVPLKEWIRDESAEALAAGRCEQVLDALNWEVEHPHVPRQKNLVDCGAFVLYFAERLGCAKPFERKKKFMDVFRVTCLHQCITKRI